MSSTTSATPVLPLPALPSLAVFFQSLFTKVTTDEASQAIAAILPPIQALSTGDGSGAEVIGAGIQIKGAVVSNLAVFQKIGVNDLAAAIAADLQAYQAQIQQIATAGAGATGSAV